jgi:hypothetical protein
MARIQKHTPTQSCDGCGTKTPLHLLDSRPRLLLGRFRATHRKLARLADRGADFDHNYCSRCFGPAWQPSAALKAAEEQ